MKMLLLLYTVKIFYCAMSMSYAEQIERVPTPKCCLYFIIPMELLQDETLPSKSNKHIRSINEENLRNQNLLPDENSDALLEQSLPPDSPKSADAINLNQTDDIVDETVISPLSPQSPESVVTPPLDITRVETPPKSSLIVDSENNCQTLSRVGEILEEILTRGDLSKEEDPEESCSSATSSLTLIDSPFVTTPPYEYIVLTPENEKKFRLYLNPKLDLRFKEEVAKLPPLTYQREKSRVELGNPCSWSERGSFATARSRSCSRTILPMPHMEGNENVVHCFDDSQVELELGKILKQKPPQTHGIVRRKPRDERGSSVPAIDSYYGCKDLEKVGHASYFIPDLSPQERKAIGWKDTYTYGKWKYAATVIPHATSGHIPLGATFPSAKPLIDKFKSVSRSASRSFTRSKKFTTKAKDKSFVTFQDKHKISSSKDGGKLSTTKDSTTLHRKSDIKFPSSSTEIGSKLLGGNRVLKVSAEKSQEKSLKKQKLKRWLHQVVPCIKSSIPPEEEKIVRKKASREVISLDVDLTLPRNTEGLSKSHHDNILQQTTSERGQSCGKSFRTIFRKFSSKHGSDHSKRRSFHILRKSPSGDTYFGCFHRTRKTQVCGGDFLASSSSSVASFKFRNRNLQTDSEIFALMDMKSEEFKQEYQAWEDNQVIQNDKIEMGSEVSKFKKIEVRTLSSDLIAMPEKLSPKQIKTKCQNGNYCENSLNNNLEVHGVSICPNDVTKFEILELGDLDEILEGLTNPYDNSYDNDNAISFQEWLDGNEGESDIEDYFEGALDQINSIIDKHKHDPPKALKILQEYFNEHFYLDE